MFSFSLPKSEIIAFVEKQPLKDKVNIMRNGITEFTSRFIYSISIVALVSSLSYAQTAEEKLQAQISVLDAQVNKLALDQPAAFARLNGKITTLQANLSQLNLGTSVVLAQGFLKPVKGSTFDMSISLFAGSLAPISLQGDLIVPAGLTLVSIIAGPSSTGSGKQLTTNLVNGNVRFVIFGLNQTPIGAGVVAIARFTATANTGSNLPVSIINPVSSDAAGKAMPTSDVSGTVQVN